MSEQALTMDQLKDVVRGTVRDMGLEAKADEVTDQLERFRREWDAKSSGERAQDTLAAHQAALAGVKAPRVGAQGDQRGTNLARALLGMAKHSVKNGVPASLSSALPTLKAMGGRYEEVAKALQASDLTAGGALLPEDYSADFIEFLHAMSVVRQMGARIVQIDSGRMIIGRQNSTATAYWVGESQAITESQEGYGNVVLDLKKLGILVPISNDLIRRNTIPRGIVELVRDDITRVALNAEEKALLDGTGAAGQPTGIFSLMASGNRFNANGTFNVANATSDLLKLQYKVIGADVPMVSPGFVSNPRLKFALMSLRTDDGYPVFMDMLSRGELYGYPAMFTNNVLATYDDTTDGSNDETRCYFADWAEVVIGEGATLDVQQASQASYVNGSSATIHGFQQDETIVRMIHETDVALRHDVGAACLKGIDWRASFDS